VIQLYICQFNQYFQLVAKLHQRRTVKPIKLFHQPLNRADDEMKYIDPFNPTGEWVSEMDSESVYWIEFTL
jgi:hypothetical protein